MGGISSFFGKMLGSDKIIDAAVNTGDALFYTKEEKAESYLRVMKMYESFKIAQRFLALIFSIPYMLAWTVTFSASYFVDVTVQQQLLDGDVSRIVYIIVGFYFLGGATEGTVKAISWIRGEKTSSTR